MMYMFMEFTRDVQFVFQTWYAKAADSPGYFALGLILTFLYCVGHSSLLPIAEERMKSILKGKQREMKIVVLNVFHFIFQLSNIFVMMLMMTMNFYVGLVIAAGCAFGYSIKSAQKDYTAACQANRNSNSCHSSHETSLLQKKQHI